MAAPLCSEAEFIELFETLGPHEMSKRLGGDLRSIYKRRANVEAKIGRAIKVPKHLAVHAPTERIPTYSHRLEYDIPDGVVLIGSDAHYWPGPASAAHRAFVKFCKEMKPKLVIVNGDALDGARISRHAPIGWENRPALIDEIEATKERLGEIEKAAGRAHKTWNLGNHDARFETRIATVAPEYAKVHGVHLRDHFPLWSPAWATWINDDVVVKHRFKGGIHATHNNTMWAGKTMVTGHLHSAKVTPFSDYNGTRYGVDAGCLADPYGPAFVDYTEDSPRNWRSGFCVLTFRAGRLMLPELCLTVDADHVEFRGELIRV